MPKENNETSEIDWRSLRLVLIAGAVGGLSSWVFGWITENPVRGGWLGVPAAIFLGSFSAGVAVYVLTNTDTSAVLRTIFFAALCGFAWKPVCDAGVAFINQSIQNQEDKEAEELATTVYHQAASLANASSAELPARLDEVSESLSAAVTSIGDINNRKGRRKAEQNVVNALRVVSQVAPKSPESAAHVIQNTAEVALKHSALNVSEAAVSSLDKLAGTNRQFLPAKAQLATNMSTMFMRRVKIDRANP